MLLAALLMLVAGAPPASTAPARADDNGPPPGSQYPPPPPLVQDPAQWQTPPPAPPPQPAPAPPQPSAPPPAYPPTPYPATPYPPSPYPPSPYQQPAPPPAPQPQPPPPPAASVAAAPPAPGADVGSRLSFGIGLHLGAAQDTFTVSSPGTLGAGLYLRLGDEFNDVWGLEAEVAGGTLVIADYVRESITLDITPADWFTFAIGPSLREDIDSYVQGCFGSTCETSVVEAFGGTVRLDFHLGAKRTASGRSAFTLGVAGDVGATVGSNIYFGDSGIAYAIYLTMGYARY